jgi:D-alanine transaminase
MRIVYLNGNFIPENEAKISAFDRGFLFADAVYEVISVLGGRLIDFDGHMGRLDRSLDALSIKAAIARDEWLSIFRRLVSDNYLAEGLIYLQVTRGNPGDRSFFWPPEDTPPTVFAFTQALPLVETATSKSGISVITLPDLRWGRADIKTTQLLYASMMKMEAKASGADDAWLLRDGMISEGTSQNAHIITHDNVLVTHQLDRKILHGITRVSVLELAAQRSLRIEERAFSVAEAESAKEAFVSAASAFVLPVVKINGQQIGDGKPGVTTALLRQAYVEWARATAI